MWAGTITEDYIPNYIYLGHSSKIFDSILNQLYADLANVHELLKTAKGKEKNKLEGVAEGLEYTIDFDTMKIIDYYEFRYGITNTLHVLYMVFWLIVIFSL